MATLQQIRDRLDARYESYDVGPFKVVDAGEGWATEIRKHPVRATEVKGDQEIITKLFVYQRGTEFRLSKDDREDVVRAWVDDAAQTQFGDVAIWKWSQPHNTARFSAYGAGNTLEYFSVTETAPNTFAWAQITAAEFH